MLAGQPSRPPAFTEAEKLALKQAVVACEAEAKGKKIKGLSNRKYVNQCVVAALKEHSSIDVARMLEENPEIATISIEQWRAIRSFSLELTALMTPQVVTAAASYFDVARARKSVSARRSSAEPMCCSGILVPGV
jgi:hypothetical protein